MKFQYYPDDPMDELPAPVNKVVFSFIAITALYIAYIFLWSAILTG